MYFLVLQYLNKSLKNLADAGFSANYYTTLHIFCLSQNYSSLKLWTIVPKNHTLHTPISLFFNGMLFNLTWTARVVVGMTKICPIFLFILIFIRTMTAWNWKLWKRKVIAIILSEWCFSYISCSQSLLNAYVNKNI